MGRTQEVIAAFLRGEPVAEERVFEELYEATRRVARKLLAQERRQSVAATDVAHDVLVEVRGSGQKVKGREAVNRADFLYLVSRAVRQWFVQEHRRRSADKRGGGEVPLTVDTEVLGMERQIVPDYLDLHRAMGALEESFPDGARVVSLHFWMGLTLKETAEVVGNSVATVKRRWNTSRRFLRDQLAFGSQR